MIVSKSFNWPLMTIVLTLGWGLFWYHSKYTFELKLNGGVRLLMLCGWDAVAFLLYQRYIGYNFIVFLCLHNSIRSQNATIKQWTLSRNADTTPITLSLLLFYSCTKKQMFYIRTAIMWSHEEQRVSYEFTQQWSLRAIMWCDNWWHILLKTSLWNSWRKELQPLEA